MPSEVETMAYMGETPWHGLGNLVTEDLTPEQFRKKAGLDWEVKRIQNQIQFKGKRQKINSWSIVRDDTGDLLTTIPQGWQYVTNQTFWDFFEEHVMTGGLKLHTAGSLRCGKVLWILAKTQEKFAVFGDDEVESYFLFTLPHEYGRAIDLRTTAERVVCANTLEMAMYGPSKKGIKLNHRKPFDPDFVKNTLNMTRNNMESFKSMSEFMGSRKYNKDDLTKFFKEMFPITGKQTEKNKDKSSKIATAALEIIETQPGAEYAPGTWYSAFNAVTNIVDHKRGNNPESRFESAMYGDGRNLKIKAIKRAIEYAEAA